jgi:hypothetical protein
MNKRKEQNSSINGNIAEKNNTIRENDREGEMNPPQAPQETIYIFLCSLKNHTRPFLPGHHLSHLEAILRQIIRRK